VNNDEGNGFHDENDDGVDNKNDDSVDDEKNGNDRARGNHLHRGRRRRPPVGAL
jgi:hypothetical protein